MKQGTTGTGSGQSSPGHRVFTGTVTKFHENFGFVDEDVFFQTSVVKGQTPRVNVCTKYSKEMRFECYNVAILPQKLFYFILSKTYIAINVANNLLKFKTVSWSHDPVTRSRR